MTTANTYCVTDALADVTLLDKSIPDKISSLYATSIPEYNYPV